MKSAEILIFDIYLLGYGWEQPQVGKSPLSAGSWWIGCSPSDFKRPSVLSLPEKNTFWIPTTTPLIYLDDQNTGSWLFQNLLLEWIVTNSNLFPVLLGELLLLFISFSPLLNRTNLCFNVKFWNTPSQLKDSPSVSLALPRSHSCRQQSRFLSWENWIRTSN